MTYTPSAYAMRHDDKWWIVVSTPSGLSARLNTTYRTQAGAEQGIETYGFRLIVAPKQDDLRIGRAVK